jgi:NUMOD3 motif
MMPAKITHRIRPGYPRWLTQARLRDLRTDFVAQRSSAKDRGIDFNLSFGQWLGIWIASGKLLKRGRHRGDFVMARIGDRGAYALGNIEIIPHVENIRQFHLGKIVSPETCRKISAAKIGQPKSPEHRAKLSLALRGRPWSQRRRDAAQPEARP